MCNGCARCGYVFMTMLFHLLLAIVSLGCAFAARRAGMSPGAALAMPALFGVFAVWQVACGVMVACGRSRARPVLTLGGFSWTLNDFCRGWLVTSETGSGKTLSAINAMLWQVSKNCPRRGGICIDDKGLYWETLSAMFRALGREQDLILLQVRPDGAPADWEPSHTFNCLEDARLPFSAKAKDVCDVAVSLGQDGDQAFFKTQAEIQMNFAFQALACAELSVTLNNAYEILSSDDGMKEIIGVLDEKNTPESRELGPCGNPKKIGARKTGEPQMTLWFGFHMPTEVTCVPAVFNQKTIYFISALSAFSNSVSTK